MNHGSCCAATFGYVRGTGRHLVAHLAEVPQELPQAYRRSNRWHPDSETIDIFQQHWWTRAERDDRGCTRLLQVLGSEGCRVHRGLERVAKHHEQDCAHLPPVPDTEGCRVHRGLERVAKHHETRSCTPTSSAWHWRLQGPLRTWSGCSASWVSLKLPISTTYGTWHQWSRFRLSLPTSTTSRSSRRYLTSVITISPEPANSNYIKIQQAGVSVLLFKRVNSRIHLQEIVFWSEWHASEQRNSWIHFSCFYRCEWLPVGQQVLIAPPARRARSFTNTTDSFLLRSRPPRSSP